MPGLQSKSKRKESGKDPTPEKAPNSGALESGSPVGIPLFLQGRFAAVQAKRDLVSDDPFEREAESVAQTVSGPNVKDAASDSAGARPLHPAVRKKVEPVLGTDLSDVRVHSDAEARQAAAGIGAKAFTFGKDIWLGPTGHAGDVRLMAHEATHVRQQARDGAPRVQRQPVPDGDANSCTMPTGVTYDFSGPLSPPFSPLMVPNEVKVSNPNELIFQPETIVLDEPVLESLPIVLYAIPIELTNLDPLQGGGSLVCRAPNSSRDQSAPFTPATTPAPPAQSTPASNLLKIPGFNAPKVATADGIVITPELVTDAVVIVSEYHHFSVGAGATTLLKTPQGIRLIDAGVGIQGREALSQALVEKIGGIVGEEPIFEVMITHLHEDHTSLLPRLAERFPIGRLRVNSLQFADPRFQRLLADMTASQAKGAQDRAVAKLKAGWEKGEGSTIADKALRDQAFEVAKQRVIQQALADLVAQPTQVELLIPGEGGKLVVDNTPLGDLPSLAKAPEDPITEGLHRAGVPGDIADTAVVDPSLGKKQARQQDQWAKESEPDPKKRSEVDDAVIDTASTSWIIDLPGGNRLMVVPDLRTDDLRGEGKTRRDASKTELGHFEQALAALTKPGAKFTAWNMTHHMQSGWVAGTHIARVGELVRFTEFMNRVRQVQAAQRAPGQKAPADIVVVSAQHDMARSMIDPAMVWFLRSLGFEAFLASSGRDVRLIEATTAGGQKIEGIAGLPYEGLRPSDPLLKQSEEAIRHLDQKWQLEDARKAPPRMKTADKSALKADREANQARIDKAREAIRAARESYIATVNSEIGRGPHDAAKPSVAPDPAKPLPTAIQTAEQALRDAMRAPDLADFTPSATPETPIISDTALVLMRLHGDTPLDPLDRQIAQANERLDLLRAKLQAGEEPVQTKAQLSVELDQFRKLIQQKLPTASEASKPVLEEELANSQKELESIVHPKEGQPLYSREPGTGRLIQSRVIAAPTETKAADTVRKVAGKASQALGAVMVIQTISAEDELIKNVQEGKANKAEAIVGTVKNVQGIAIGVRMMTVMEVHPAEFVVMSLLDIAQTALADYASPEQRAVAFAKSGLRAAITIGLMYVGEGMMASGNPYVVAAGFGIMFLTEPIMDLLDAAGLFDAIERWSAFLPSEVTGANQHLRDLMEEYRGILGAMQLAGRSNEDLQKLGVSDPEGLRRAASLDMETYRQRAVGKEAELLNAFDEGYTRAQKEFAGLYELDALRSQFLILRQQVHEGDTLRDDWSRKSALNRFELIDKGMSLDNMSGEEIDDMPQWGKLNDAMDDMADLLSRVEIDWDDVRKKERDIDQMFRNAHYRLDPQTFGLRSTPLFSEGTSARAAYEGKLEIAEMRMDGLRKWMVQAFAPDSGIASAEGDVTFDDVELALQQYTNLQDNATDAGHDRPFTAADLNRRSLVAGPEYRNYVNSHDDYANALGKLEASETLLTSMALRAARTKAIGPPTENEVTLPARIQSAISRRQLVGLLYLDEIDERVANIRDAEVKTLAPILGERKDVIPLSAEEKDVLHHHELKDYLYGVGTITNRLQDIPNLHLPDKPEEAVYGIGLLVDEDYNATRANRVLVGTMGDAGETVTMSGHHQNVYVIALTPQAISFIGTRRIRVWDSSVQGVTLKELQEMALSQK